MHPDRASSGHSLDQDEAVQDATALVGHLDAERTERLNGGPPQHQRPDPQQIGQEWNRISATIADLYVARIPVHDSRVQTIVHDHYQWICHFWIPDGESYMRLAHLYVSQPKFRKRIERKKPAGTAAYLKAAMMHYASDRLR